MKLVHADCALTRRVRRCCRTQPESLPPPAADAVVPRQSPPRPDGAGAASPPGPAPARLLAQLRQQAERLLSAERWEAAALVLGEALSTLAESAQLLDESGELRAQLLTLRAEAVTKHVRSEAERVGGARSAQLDEFQYFMRLGEALETAECISEAAAAFEKAGLLGLQSEASAKAVARALRLRASFKA